MDEAQLRGLAVLTQNLEVFSAHCLKVKDKVGALVPFIWNKAQHHIHEALEAQLAERGMVRALLLKGRQQGGCLDPSTPVLKADLTWVPIESLVEGDEVVSCDEEAEPGAVCRKMRTAVVEKVWRTEKPGYRINFDDGSSVTCSADHRWLSKKSQTRAAWRSIAGSERDNTGRSKLGVGDSVRTIVSPWGERDMDDAWLGGMIDGEGSFDAFKGSGGARLAISQVSGPVLERMEGICRYRGYGHYIISDDGPRKTKYGKRAVHAINIGDIRQLFRIMGLSRPTRFAGIRWWEGKRMPDNGWRKIVSIEALPTIPLVDIQTSTRAYVANGFVSHNSTYIGARFYHKTTTQFGKSAFIVAHEQKATDNLYSMVKRYHDHNPLPVSTGATNAKELIFDKLDGGYKLATAGSKDVGRSNTAQLLHGSEFAFWANAQMHLAGIGNTIGDMPGSEIILESTANGVGNAFHLMWQAAERGEGDYIAIFIPWFWQEEYRAPLKPDFKMSAEDEAVMRTYGLDLEQMQWRANKIATYGEGFEWLFQQEYPCCAAEAFKSSTQNPLINPSAVMAAVNSGYRDMSGPLIIGCDPAGDGVNDPDRTAIAFRRGRVAPRIEYHSKLNTMQIAGKLAEYFRDMGPDAIFVDKGGLGAGVVDRLRELNIPVVGVNSAERARDHEIYENRRAEMWWTMKQWFDDAPVRIPNDQALISDITAPQPKVSSNGRKLLEKKEDMAKRQIRSPDGGDALALTFAEPVAYRTGSPASGMGGTYTPATAAGY